MVAAGAGVGIGHLAWPGSQSAAPGPVAMRSGSDSGSPTTGGSTGGSTAVPNGNPGGAGDGNGATQPGQSPGGATQPGQSPGGATQPGGPWPGLGNWPDLGNGQGGNGQGEGPDDGSGSGGAAPGVSSAPGSPSNIAGIVGRVDDAVVDIDVTFAYQHAAGAGTGIVLTPTGEVLTNNHVIDGATSISVTDVGNGKTYAASVVGYDPSGDVAVLQLKDATGLATAHLADSDSLTVGDAVVGIGNAGGVGGTPSAAGGSVIALNRSISVGDELYATTAHLKGLIEVNADIESGDSGGPLVNGSGSVVGMDTAAAAQPAADGVGDGYAIPIDTALSVAKTIESGSGTAEVHVGPTAALGVLVSTAQQPSEPGEPGTAGPNGTSVPGALVAGVVDGGAAASAGLQQGDVVTSIGGHTVSSPAQLSALMLAYHPGQRVTLSWTDPAGHAEHATITLGTGPSA